MDPFVIQLSELCRAEPTRAKWVVVPGHALGHTLGERLALEGTSWANLRVTTPLDLALPMAAPGLLARGIDPAPDGIGPALIMRLLLELPPRTPRYFRALAEQPTLAEALWATIRELRVAGLVAADLTPDAFASRTKHAELRAVLVAYEAHLARQRLADIADVYREALRHPDGGPVQPTDLTIELPGVIWAPLERRLLDALPGTRLTPRTLRLPNLPVPRRLADPGERRNPAPSSDTERLAFLLEPAAAPPPRQDGTLTMFRAGGPDAEVEEVFRRILATGLPLDRVEIACASPDALPLVWEKAQRHDWPVTVGPGLPITRTRPARALLAFCDWIEGGLAAEGLRRMLQSGDLRLDLGDGPTAGQAARLLARSEATWGRQTYGPAMAALRAEFERRARDPETDDETRARGLERAAQTTRLGAWIEGLLQLVPEPVDGRVRVGALIEAGVRFVREVTARTSELDGAAAVVVAEALEALQVLDDLARAPREALGLVRHPLEALTVGSDRARPGHLFVTTLRQAGYAGRPHTFVVGLEEGRVFPALLEDPVLLDAERDALDPALPTSHDRASEGLHAVVARLGALGGSVGLSFSCRDLREPRETFPSWLLLQALRLQRPDRDWTYHELTAALGEPVSAVPAMPAQALSEAGWWLAHVRGVGPAALPAIHAAFPALAQGDAAEAERDSDAFTVHDGWVRAAGVRLDPRGTGRAVSATALEHLARCPFGYFLERGLGLEAIGAAEPDRDEWLGPLARGTLLHELYAAILREARAQGETLTPARHAPRLVRLAEARLAALRATRPPPSDAIFAQERREILDDVAVFLRLEASQTGREPVGVEVAFGGGSADDEPLAQAEPVVVDLGPGLRVRLRGRIDRIDRLANGTYEVVDYKTGWYRPRDYAGTVDGGRRLQPVL